MIRCADLYYQYMFGFHAGAGIKAIDPKRAEHSDETMRKAYSDGWAAGRKASHVASDFAAEYYGYTPSIMRPVQQKEQQP